MAEQSREAGAEAEAGRRKETKRRSLAGKGGELLICPLVDGARLSSLGEKGKVRIVVAVIFSNLISLSYEDVEYLKVVSQIFISYGIFSIGLQSGKLDLSDIKPKPFMIATSVWIIVVPVAYLISIN